MPNTRYNKVNGCLSASTHLDGLEDVVSQDGYRDAETFDICFRSGLGLGFFSTDAMMRRLQSKIQPQHYWCCFAAV